VRKVDPTLVTRLNRGEPSAFDDAYARFRPGLFSFLVRLSRRRDLAEELLQETWLRLATHAASLDPETDLGAWLFTVARNLYRSFRRWHLIDSARLELFRLGLAQRRPSESPFELAAASETERRLDLALSSLPTGYREILLLVAVEKLEPAQVATVLGLRPEAARQRLSRARALLARILEEPCALPRLSRETP
jgi:RNA polymerase sigma-70 factor (ECF subfamily)